MKATWSSHINVVKRYTVKSYIKKRCTDLGLYAKISIQNQTIHFRIEGEYDKMIQLRSEMSQFTK